MFRKRSSSKSGTAQEGDELLSRVLQTWRGIEPRDNFEAVVWRRIRTASVSEKRFVPAAIDVRAWFVPRPVWLSAAAAVAGLVFGVGLAFSTSGGRDGRQTADPLLQAQTLAGSYLAMATGGAR